MAHIKKSKNPRFAYDAYRRFVSMYGDVVLDMKPKGKDDIDPFEEILEAKKKGYNVDPEAIRMALARLDNIVNAGLKEYPYYKKRENSLIQMKTYALYVLAMAKHPNLPAMNWMSSTRRTSICRYRRLKSAVEEFLMASTNSFKNVSVET